MLHSDNFMVGFKIVDYYYYLVLSPKESNPLSIQIILFKSACYTDVILLLETTRSLNASPIPTIVELLRGNLMTLCLIE
jgi:hypothetical protein